MVVHVPRSLSCVMDNTQKYSTPNEIKTITERMVTMHVGETVLYC